METKNVILTWDTKDEKDIVLALGNIVIARITEEYSSDLEKVVWRGKLIEHDSLIDCSRYFNSFKEAMQYAEEKLIKKGNGNLHLEEPQYEITKFIDLPKDIPLNKDGEIGIVLTCDYSSLFDENLILRFDPNIVEIVKNIDWYDTGITQEIEESIFKIAREKYGLQASIEDTYLGDIRVEYFDPKRKFYIAYDGEDEVINFADNKPEDPMYTQIKFK